MRCLRTLWNLNMAQEVRSCTRLYSWNKYKKSATEFQSKMPVILFAMPYLSDEYKIIHWHGNMILHAKILWECASKPTHFKGRQKDQNKPYARFVQWILEMECWDATYLKNWVLSWKLGSWNNFDYFLKMKKVGFKDTTAFGKWGSFWHIGGKKMQFLLNANPAYV